MEALPPPPGTLVQIRPFPHRHGDQQRIQSQTEVLFAPQEKASSCAGAVRQGGWIWGAHGYRSSMNIWIWGASHGYRSPIQTFFRFQLMHAKVSIWSSFGYGDFTSGCQGISLNISTQELPEHWHWRVNGKLRPQNIWPLVLTNFGGPGISFC